MLDARNVRDISGMFLAVMDTDYCTIQSDACCGFQGGRSFLEPCRSFCTFED